MFSTCKDTIRNKTTNANLENKTQHLFLSFYMYFKSIINPLLDSLNIVISNLIEL